MSRPLYRINLKKLREEGSTANKSGMVLAVVDLPANEVKGLAFNSENEKILKFADDSKQIIAAPVIIPNRKIYRLDQETGFEFDVVFDEDAVEDAAYYFNEQNINDKYNEMHFNNKKIDAKILLSWIVNDPKTDRAYTKYGIEVPKGTWFAEVKIEDKEVFERFKAEGKTGFSPEAFFGLDLLLKEQTKLEFNKIVESYIKNKKIENKMKKLRFNARPIKAKQIKSKLKFEEITEVSDITVVTEEIKEGESVVVIDENLTVIENYTGDVISEVGDVIVIEEGEIVEITSEAAPSGTELSEDEKAKLEAEKEDEKAKTELETEVTTDTNTDTDAIVSALTASLSTTLSQIYEKLAEIVDKMGSNGAMKFEKEIELPISFSQTLKNVNSVKYDK